MLLDRFLFRHARQQVRPAGQLIHLVDRIYDTLVHRAQHSPLMTVVDKHFGSDVEGVRAARQRVTMFHLWCIHRSIGAYSRHHHRPDELIEISDRRCHQLIVKSAGISPGAAQASVTVAEQAFAQFDQAMTRREGQGWPHWLGRTVLEFVTRAHYSPHIASQAMAFSLPADILRETETDTYHLMRALHV
jgi:hypothetical protein